MAKGKKKEGKKAEKSPCPPVSTQDTTSESSSIKQTDLQTFEDGVEKTQASPAIPDTEPDTEPDTKPEKAREPPVQDVPQYYEESVLNEIIIKRYEGEKVKGLYEGEGFAYFEEGNTYKGSFCKGLIHGQGTYTWADGVKYEGAFVRNMQLFSGRYTWNDGSTYEGSIKNGLRHGFGYFRSGTHPVSYIGYWCKGKRHGKGTIYYDQQHTSWYSGDWVNNVKEGWGMRCYKSGNTYEGQWEKNVRHGKGRMRWLTANQEYMGQWVYGIQHGYGTHVWYLQNVHASRCALRNEYIGDFVNGERHGHGRFISASGVAYDGEWVCNKKHGKGKFVFKNGHVFEGEFKDDRLVEYPTFPVDAKELNGIHTGSHFSIVINDSENTSVLGSDIELDISSLLDLFPREERHEELKQVEFAVLRHITNLRRIYTFYSSLGCDHSLDNTFLMTKLQFWRFLKDCQFHSFKLTLAEMDRILSGDKTPLEKIHCPYDTLLFRTFLSYLIHLAFYIYYEDNKDKGPYLQKCFLEMMSHNITPAACHVQGTLFSEEQLTVLAMSYIDKCWEIYRAFRRPNTRPPFEPTVKMRHFLWMFNDFKLLSKQLTASRLVEILVKDSPSLRDSSSNNLEPELVFLEFVEALLECASVYVTSDMIKEHVTCENWKSRVEGLSKGTTNVSLYPECSQSQLLTPCEDRGHPSQEFLPVPDTVLSFNTPHGDIEEGLSLFIQDTEKEQDLYPAKEWTDKSKEAKTEQDEKVSLWMCQVQIFFTTKLFPAYQHEKVLEEKIKEKRIQDAEFAEMRKIKDEELAKLIAERDEARPAAAAEKIFDSKSADFKELEEPVTISPPKKRTTVVKSPVGTKVPAGKRK